MKYSPAKTAAKTAPAIIPVIVGEVLPVIFPQIDRGNAYAIGTAILAGFSAIRNWFKNRKKAV